jgi:hypothetical protein
MACTGNSAEQCGGPNRLNLFSDGTTPPTTPAGPVTDPGPPGWEFLGCYADNVDGGRTLTTGVATAGGGGALTVALCTEACGAANFNYAGVEYSGECYCGDAFENGGGPAPDGLVGCDMTCNGNATEYCGGPNRLDVYNSTSAAPPPPTPTGGPINDPGPPGWEFIGCYADNVDGGRALTYGINTAGGGAELTVALCTEACGEAHYQYAGVEYAGECYCGNAFENGGGPAPDGLVGCDMTCNGNSSEYCGGPNRLDVYNSTGTIPPTTTDTVVPTATGSGTATDLPSGWTYGGCWIDNAFGGRILAVGEAGSTAVTTALTIESCIAACTAAGYTVAGVEYSTQCYCGDEIIEGGALSADTDCNMACGGASTEICGGPNRMSIYATGSLVAIAPPATQTSGLPGSWQYQGCIS